MDVISEERSLSRRSFLKLGGAAACTVGASVLTSSLLAPETARATVVGDQTPLTEEEIEEAIRSGEILTEYPESPVAMYASTSYAVRTVGGTNRYRTNALQVSEAFSQCEWAIIASGAGYADSICAAGLAGALDCPIILSEPETLSAPALSSLESIGAKNVIVLGGTDVISEEVEQSLISFVGSADRVVRLCGDDRYATQMAVYEYGVERGLWGDTVVVANATGFADALAVSPLSFKLKAPVFYVDDTGYFPAEQEEAILGCGKASFIMVGGSVVMSSRTESLLKTLGSVTRLSGDDRYATSRAIASYAISNCGMSWNNMALASGGAPYDALGGGPAQGKLNSVIVLTIENSHLNTPTIPFSSKPSSIKFYGGKSVFSNAYKARFCLAAGYTLADIEGLRVYVDAGHGGEDPGACKNGYTESIETAELSSKVSSYLLSQHGISSYTNLSGNNHSLRHPEARAMDCSVFVSIHFNSVESGNATGTESYIHTYNSAVGSKTLQHSVHTELVSALGLTDRTEKREIYAVTSGELPSVLLEICFISNANDMSTYKSREDKVAQAIARGIANA